MQSGTEAVNLRWLSRFPELAKITDAAWLEAVRAASVRVIPSGTLLFRPGHPCSGFVLVFTGAVRVLLPSENGREIVLYRVEAGEGCILTLPNLLDGSAYMVEGVAETESHLVVIPPHHFDHALAASPDFRRFIFSMIGRCLAKMMSLLGGIVFKRLDIRLAQLLVRCASDNEHSTCTTIHQDLAAELGSSREVISRLLKEFERNGWIRLDRGRIEVLLPAEMERLSSL